VGLLHPVFKGDDAEWVKDRQSKSSVVGKNIQLRMAVKFKKDLFLF
jgi:hypothetical protein